MILHPREGGTRLDSIPRESGDDPGFIIRMTDLQVYSPRERG